MDKPLFQHTYANNIATTIFTFGEASEVALLFFKVLIKKWNTIDYLRLNKFLWLLRDYSHNCIISLKDEKALRKFVFAILKMTVDFEPCGLIINFFQMSVEELSVIDKDNPVSSDSIMAYIKPIIKITAFSRKMNLIESMKELLQKVINKETILKNVDIEGIKELIFKNAKLKNINDDNRKILYGLIGQQQEPEEVKEEEPKPTHEFKKLDKHDKRKMQKDIKRAKSAATLKDGIPLKLKKIMDASKNDE